MWKHSAQPKTHWECRRRRQSNEDRSEAWLGLQAPTHDVRVVWNNRKRGQYFVDSHHDRLEQTVQSELCSLGESHAAKHGGAVPFKTVGQANQRTVHSNIWLHGKDNVKPPVRERAGRDERAAHPLNIRGARGNGVEQVLLRMHSGKLRNCEEVRGGLAKGKITVCAAVVQRDDHTEVQLEVQGPGKDKDRAIHSSSISSVVDRAEEDD